MVENVEWPKIGMTLEEAAEALRVDPRTLRNLIKAGDFPACKVGVGWRIDPDTARDWLKRKTLAPRQPGDTDPE